MIASVPTSTPARPPTTVSDSTSNAAPTTTRPAPAPPVTTPPTATSPPSTTAPSTTVPPVPTTTVAAPPPPPPTSTSTSTATVVRIGDTSERAVALTFDAGSDAGHTGRILEELASHGIRATFALTGEWVEQNPGLAQRIAAAGHVVMNHSYDHPSFTGVSSDDVVLTTESRWNQLDRAETVIRSITGTTSLPYFRPPFGDQDASVARDAGARGYRFVVMWTVDSLGWKGTDPADVVARCLERAQPGAILMFHVGSASTDAEALPAIIDRLDDLGYRFATITELIG